MIRKAGVLVTAIIVVILMAGTAAWAAPQKMLTRHTRDVVVNGIAQPLGRMPASQILHFDVVLPLRDAPELENFLKEVYDPNSRNYRHFVTVREFTERFGPSQEDYDALIAFAQNNGFKVVSGSRDGMDVGFTAPVSVAEKAFHVTINRYQHPTEKREFYAPDREPTVDLPFPLWHVSGLDNYSVPRPTFVRKDNAAVVKPAANPDGTVGSCPEQSYCGSDMRAAYYGGTALTGAGQSLGLLEFGGFQMSDLFTYYQQTGQTLNVPVIGISVDNAPVYCTYNPDPLICDDGEQILDMTQALGMAPNLYALYVFVGPASGSSDTAVLSAMTTQTPLAMQLSSSWTWEPPSPQADDLFFEKMAAQGQSFFQATGDYGSYLNGVYQGEVPVFPADDPWVTAVGGTDLITQSGGGPWVSETAWQDGGGGFYDVDFVPIPSYQQTAGVITTENQGSTVLRNSPDVAAESNFDFYTCADQLGCMANVYGGTSFAAPMWAGFIALANEQAAANGNPPIGFLNPTMYQMGLSANYNNLFHDITVGSNIGPFNPGFGYPAVVGYDLATGWGSPNGEALIGALASQQNEQPAVSFSAATLAFGNEAVGNTNSKTITLKNIGTSTLDLTSISVNDAFAISSNTCKSTLAKGKSCKIEVTFTPTQLGLAEGAVLVIDNAVNSPQSIPLSGTGSAAVTLSPTSATFPTEKVGKTSRPVTFTLANNQSVTLDSIAVEATGDFSVSTKGTTCTTTLAANSSCKINVLFTPTQTGTRTGMLQVSNNATGSPETAALTGTGE
jgi:kumamolisin